MFAILLAYLSLGSASLGYSFNSNSSSVLCLWEIGLILTYPVFLDPVSCLFLASVSLITSSVLVFTSSYMAHEKFYFRFLALVFLFVLRILILIIRPGLIRLLIGWDGLGVTSFLLVVYFYSSKSINAGIITALSNRVGDCLILSSYALVLWSSPYLTFLRTTKRGERCVCAFLLILASTTKRAQVPFSAWLPAAMAAPTPVSSLVHSSTLVTAGVFLIVRFTGFLGEALPYYLLLVGSSTILIARVTALFETDIKKIVALSTLRQLGLIISALGINLPKVAFFHLLTHAFFKALLFVSIGSVIHIRAGYQDLRSVSFSPSSTQITLRFSLIANFSLIGVPFLRGFFSKDLILESVLRAPIGSLETLIFAIRIRLTAAYSVRIITTLIWGTQHNDFVVWTQDSRCPTAASMLLLWPLAIIAGSLLQWALFYTPEVKALPGFIKLVIPSLLFLGITSGLLIDKISPQALSPWVWGNLWSLPYSSSITQPLSRRTRSLCYQNLDLQWTHPNLLLAFRYQTTGILLEPLINKIFRRTLFSLLLYILWKLY